MVNDILLKMVAALSLSSLALVCQGVEYCDNGLICPEGNTCCKNGCIPSDLGKYHATCCTDDDFTGCGVEYSCGLNEDCVANDPFKDVLVQRLPRYHLCHPSAGSLTRVHGFPINTRSPSSLAYYSSHGDVRAANISRIDQVLIVVHGANRNADDYFCVASAAVAMQSNYKNVLVVAPRFLAPSDGPIDLQEGGTALRWDGQESGSWRYGARSIEPRQELVSSFAAMDVLVEMLMDRVGRSIPFVLVGHSSGGQFVQRWALLTSAWHANRFRAVVINPSSYAYLTPLRKTENGEWRVPSNTTTKCSSNYNQWHWGLEAGGSQDTHYRDAAMLHLGNNSQRLIQRYKQREVYYMIGSLDRCNTTGSDQSAWCNSHGLETTCMDNLQGEMRWERNLRFFESLVRMGIDDHQRIVLEGVGHDHGLALTSSRALGVIFKEEIVIRPSSQ